MQWIHVAAAQSKYFSPRPAHKSSWSFQGEQQHQEWPSEARGIYSDEIPTATLHNATMFSRTFKHTASIHVSWSSSVHT